MNAHFDALIHHIEPSKSNLLALAQRHGLVLLTLDQRLARGLADGAVECLVAGG